MVDDGVGETGLLADVKVQIDNYLSYKGIVGDELFDCRSLGRVLLKKGI